MLSLSLSLSLSLVSPTPTMMTSCPEFDLRLMNNTSSVVTALGFQVAYMYEGNVEVCINDTYVAICDEGWDDVDAQLACNYVGFGEPFYRKLNVDRSQNFNHV